jgi:hypothetical protein
LFKLLQPRLDDVLFIGQNYESAFDEFEVLLALVVADAAAQSDKPLWGPVGRFGWKHHRGPDSPLVRIVDAARTEGAEWPPFKSGLFSGDPARFLSVADEYMKGITSLNWW